MTKRIEPQRGPSLFDLIPLEDRPVVDPETCRHVERKTETDWGSPPWVRRMTWTCDNCGRIRGRHCG